MKKFVSVLLCVAMVLSLCTVAFAVETDYPDWVTVKFDAGGTTVAEVPCPVEKGMATVEARNVPTATKDGYTLTGWYYDAVKYDLGKDITVYVEPTEIGGTITVTAIWKQNEVQPETYTISYGPDAGNMFNLVATDFYYDENKYVATKSVTILDIAESAKTKAAAKGYKFVGWAGYVDLEGHTWPVIKPGAVLNIDRDTTLTAVWEKVETPKTYHVSYNWGELQINDGNEKGQLDAAKAPVDANEYTARTVIVVKEPFDNKNVVATDVVGYVFAGWMVNGDKEYIVQPGETLMVTGDMTLTAVWTKVDCQHPFVTYKADKGTRTHSATCDECGAVVVDHEKHSYDKKGVCTKCGAKKPASSKGGSTTTTTTTKSPKTGDMGVVLYAATALLSLSGTAVVIKKRKNDK